jgi:hypothetical protein
MYGREYLTGFHIAQSYDVNEATVCRIIRKVEEVWVPPKKFRLPAKKALQPSDTVLEVILVDASEQPVERPKKDRKSTTVAKRGDILKKHS